MPRMTDIWKEIQSDAENGAKRLVAEYGDRLFAAAVSLCRNDNDAEELVFRTFDQAVRKIRQYKPTSEFFNWLYTILLNFYRMDLRKKRVTCLAVGTTEDLPEPPVEEFTELVTAAAFEELRNAVQLLDPTLRDVVTKRYFLEESVEEIARELAIPSGTVKSRLHKARSVLYAALSKQRKGE